MSLSDLIKAVVTQIEQRTGSSASLGPPDSRVTGVRIWPWRVSENQQLRASTPLGSGSGLPTNPPVEPLRLHLMITVNPPFDPASLARLEQIYHLINTQPNLSSGSSSTRLTIETLSNEELSALFQSAGQPMCGCVTIQAEAVAQS